MQTSVRHALLARMTHMTGMAVKTPFYWTWLGLTLVVFTVALPLCIWDLSRHHHERAYIVWFIAGLFCLLSFPISAYGVQAHMEHYGEPKLQKHVVRILWMPCVYGFDAWLALRFKDASIYFDTLRECYEAFVIYHFFTFIISYLEKHGSAESLLARKEQQPHLFPLSMVLKPWRMGPEFLRKCKAGVLNYVIIRPITALIAFISEARGVYGEGELFNATKSYTYVVFVNSWSQTHAIYCLILLFQATRVELEPIKPVAKFVCVKAVIFLSFYQSIAIVVLVHMHVLSSRTLSIKDYDIKDVSSGLQEFIICVEMFFAALGHQIAFPASEFADAAPAQGSKLSSVLDVLDMSDVFLDVRDRAESMGGRMVGRLMKDASGAMGGGGGRSKVKLDVADDDDLGDGDAVRLLSLGERSEGSRDGVVGSVELRADRDNMPFLAAGSQRRTASGAAAGTPGDGGEAGVMSPRGLAPAAMSTVSIGGVQVPLRDLLVPEARSPRPSSAAAAAGAGPARAAALIATAAQTCALAP